MKDISGSSHKRVVISLYGGSGCGKSTLAKGVVERIGADRSVRIPADYYLRPNPYPTLQEFFQHPLEYDWELLARVLQERDGQILQVPDYDFLNFRRVSLAGRFHFLMRPIVLIDAMMPYPGAQLSILLDAPEFERKKRIIERDQRWKTQVILNWEQHQRTLEAAVRQKVVYDMALDAMQPVEKNVDTVFTFIRDWLNV
jgi:uridine kinase